MLRRGNPGTASSTTSGAGFCFHARHWLSTQSAVNTIGLLIREFVNLSDTNGLKVSLEELLKCSVSGKGDVRAGREMGQFSSDAQIFALKTW